MSTESPIACKEAAGGKEVHVYIEPQKVNGKLTYEMLSEALMNGGYTDYRMHKEALQELVSLDYGQLSGPVSKLIAEKLDAEIFIEIGENEMRAWLTVEKAYGGQGATPERIALALEKAGLSFGLKQEVIDEAIANGVLTKTLVAEGQLPARGQNAWFENLIPEPAKVPQELENGTVDFRELNYVTTVEPGDPLLRKHPPTLGIPGMTVTGVAIPADDGDDKALVESVGSAVSQEDPYLLVATRPGKPTPRRNSIVVEDILAVSKVDISTGNIVFNGSIVINQSVASGFSVKAGGGIEIFGSVEEATLEAGGDIFINGGVSGGGGAKLIAMGTIKARFIQNATVECQKDLLIADGLLHSESRVAGKVLVGIDEGKGQINGGKVSASTLIKARLLGSPASTKTLLEVGKNPYFTQKMQDAEAALTQGKRSLEETIKSIIYIRTKSQERKDELPALEEKREQLMNQVNEYTEQLANLRKMLDQSVDDAKILALDQIYSGVHLSFGDTSRNITLDTPGSSFRLDDRGQIALGPVMDSEREWLELKDSTDKKRK